MIEILLGFLGGFIIAYSIFRKKVNITQISTIPDSPNIIGNNNKITFKKEKSGD